MQICYWPGCSNLAQRQILRHVLPILSDFNTPYTEIFTGSGSIALGILNRRARQRMIINDLDAALISLWLSARDHPHELIRQIRAFDTSHKNFDTCKAAVAATTVLPATPAEQMQLGIQMLALAQWRWSGKGGERRGGKKDHDGEKSEHEFDRMTERWVPDQLAATMMVIHNWLTFAGVEISCSDFEGVIDNGVGPMFLDPPWWHRTIYRHRFQESDHARLADALRRTTRPWVMLYGDNPEVLDQYENWTTITTLEGKDDTLVITPGTTGSRSGEPKNQGTARSAGIIAARCSMPLKIDAGNLLASVSTQAAKHYYLRIYKDRTHCEWYTPKYIFDALGCEFDLDPASPGAGIVPWIPVKRHYTKEHDGLTQPWEGFVFLNPPYDKKIKPLWLDRFIQHGNGIALVPDAIATAWQQNLFNHADLNLYLNKKVKFINGNGGKSTHNPIGSVLVAIGAQGIEGLTRARDAGLGGLQRPVP